MTIQQLNDQKRTVESWMKEQVITQANLDKDIKCLRNQIAILETIQKKVIITLDKQV